MNPYASFLGSRDPLEVISSTSKKLSDHVGSLGPSGMERSYAPGKWPARMILSHLADCEIVFAMRIRQALAEPHHIIQPFDQDAWARNYSSQDLTAESALETFAAVRKWNLSLLKNVPQDAYAKRLTHPERGEMTFRMLLETMAGHDLNHLSQLERIEAAAA